MSRHASRRDQGAIAPRSAGPGPSGGVHRTFARALGAISLVVLTALLFWLLTDDGFRVTEASVTFEGLRHADAAQVRDHLSDLDRAPNVFRVRASDIVSRLSLLTEVDAAYAKVTLPANVSVVLDERDPLFIWSDGTRSWLVDKVGMLFAPADASVEGPGEGAADSSEGAQPDSSPQPAAHAGAVARAALPVVRDARIPPVPATIGSYLSDMDFSVMVQLLALTPALLGVEPQDLQLYVDEDDGYVLESGRGWDAVFGHYTPSLQPPEVVPRQVQCLRWTLATAGDKLERVWLALSEDACGTARILEKPARKPG